MIHRWGKWLEQSAQMTLPSRPPGCSAPSSGSMQAGFIISTDPDPSLNNGTQLQSNEIDNKTILETGPDGDDVASKKLGGQWRMPTWEELLELRNDCSWTWTIDYNETGISGYIIASNVTGITDRTIFLPYHTRGYWSSTLQNYSDRFACMLSLGPSGSITLYGNNTSSGAYRACGRQVRPVTE